MSRQRQDRDDHDHLGRPSRRPLKGSIYFGEPKPGNQYRLLIAADGFGDPHQVPRRPPAGSGDRAARRRSSEDLPQVALRRIRHPPLRLRSRRSSRPRPAAASTSPKPTSSPGTTCSPDQHAAVRRHRLRAPSGRPCPGREAALQPAPRGRHVEPAGRRLQRLPPEARPRRRRPVPRRPQLHDAAGLDRLPARASPTARRPRSPPPPTTPAAPSRRTRAVPPRARSGPPTSPPDRAPTRSTRSARCTWPGRSRVRRSRLVAITPALAGPYDYGVVVVRVAIHVDPLDAQVIAVSDTVPAIIGGVPIRMRSIQVNIDKPNFIDQPDQLQPDSRSTRRASATRARSPTSPPTSRRSTAPTLPFKPKMTVAPARRAQGDQARRRTRRCSSTSRPGRATPTSRSLSVTLPTAFAIDQRHLGNICSRERARPRTQCAGRTADRHGEHDDAAARPAALGPGLRGLRLRRPAAARLHPQRPGQPACRGPKPRRVKGGPADDGPGRPRRSDRPLPASTSSAARPGYLLNTRDICAKAGQDQGRLHRPERQDLLAVGQGQDPLRQGEGQEEEAKASREEIAARL